MRKPADTQQHYPGRRPGRNGGRLALAVLALIAVAVPSGVAAQQQAPTLGRAELVAFARAHLAMNEARDELHAALARAHEDQARERARVAFERRVESILAEHDLSQGEYDETVLLVSVDAELRAALDAILAELGPDGATRAR